MSEELKPCPCCGGEARAQFEVYGTWVRVFCVECGLSTMSVPTRNFDPTPAAKLWNARPIEDALRANIDALLDENAALKEYRDGHDPKVDFPPEDVWVNMRDGCDEMNPVQYDRNMGWYYNLVSRWFPDDPELVRWYPIPPLPEPIESL